MKWTKSLERIATASEAGTMRRDVYLIENLKSLLSSPVSLLGLNFEKAGKRAVATGTVSRLISTTKLGAALKFPI